MKKQQANEHNNPPSERSEKKKNHLNRERQSKGVKNQCNIILHRTTDMREQFSIRSK